MVSVYLIGLACMMVCGFIGYKYGQATEYEVWVEYLLEKGIIVHNDDE